MPLPWNCINIDIFSKGIILKLVLAECRRLQREVHNTVEAMIRLNRMDYVLVE